MWYKCYRASLVILAIERPCLRQIVLWLWLWHTNFDLRDCNDGDDDGGSVEIFGGSYT